MLLVRLFNDRIFLKSNWNPILLDNPIFTDIHLQPLRFTWGGAFAYWVHYVRNSELFLGQRCLEIYESEYVTDKEKKEMFKDFYSVALYPKKYQDSPQALRERIRKNETIFDKREWESRIRKGKFKTDKKVGFGD